MASGGTGRQRIDIGAMGGGSSGGKPAPEKERSSSSKPKSGKGGSLDKTAMIKAVSSVAVIVLAIGFILYQMGVFEARPVGGNVELRPLTQEEQQEQQRIIKEQELPPNLRLAQPPPAGSS